MTTKATTASRHPRTLIGTRFGFWVVVGESEPAPSGMSRWICRCDCGAERTLRRAILITGTSRSCGCMTGALKSQRSKFQHERRLARMLENYIPEPNTGCWLWLGPYARRDYGHVSGFTGETLAHRLFWRHHRGAPPPGLHVLHRCDTPACVNPAHLFLGTDADNIHDMMAKGRAFWQKPARGA